MREGYCLQDAHVRLYIVRVPSVLMFFSACTFMRYCYQHSHLFLSPEHLPDGALV